MEVVVSHQDSADDRHDKLNRELGHRSVLPRELDAQENHQEGDGEVKIEIGARFEVIQIWQTHLAVISDRERPGAGDGEAVQQKLPPVGLGVLGRDRTIEDEGKCDNHEAYQRDVMMCEYGE